MIKDPIRSDSEAALDTLARLYSLVDRHAEALADLHRDRLQCRRGCSTCCQDDLTVFTVEAENIRRHHTHLLGAHRPHGPGGCAFLDDQGACRIYPDRPYVCRTQGLPLRWTDELPDGSAVEMRDICPLNEVGPPIETLDPDACWTIGPVEEALADLQSQADGGRLLRVPLRGLFRLEDTGRTNTSGQACPADHGDPGRTTP
ncbi:MAG: YkgJ family cysteine cluster protein [Phycisphaerae bacterium]|nr:YkgJ family cysteine cluster protein [Phycisphaerae bacterium]